MSNIEDNEEASHTNELVHVPEDILFPSELNQHLKDEVKYLMQENAMLRKNVEELEENFKGQEAQLVEYAQAQKAQKNSDDAFNPNDITRAKIVELSKKLREKAAELMHFKTKCAKLDQALAVMRQNEADRAEQNQVEEKPEKPPESELKILNDKITSLNSKLFDEKNHVLSLKNELKMAVKILQEEVGEPYESIQQLSSSTHWKGRAQIIAELQYKLQECKDKIKVFQDKEGSNKPTELAAKRTYMESRINKLTKENDGLRLEVEHLSKKLELTRHKLKNVDAECNNWRLKYSNMADQVEKERAFVNNIAETHSTSQIQLNESLKRRSRQVEKLQKDNKDLKSSLKTLECDIENLHKIIKEKEDLAAKKQSLRPCTPTLTTLTPSQMDVDRLRLVELTKVYSQRLQKERDDKSSFEMMYKAERQKAAKLEANLARAKLEDTGANSYTSLLSRPGFEENLEYKLELAEEKIKTLQTRLQIEKVERDQDLQEFSKIVQS